MCQSKYYALIHLPTFTQCKIENLGKLVLTYEQFIDFIASNDKLITLIFIELNA